MANVPGQIQMFWGIFVKANNRPEVFMAAHEAIKQKLRLERRGGCQRDPKVLFKAKTQSSAFFEPMRDVDGVQRYDPPPPPAPRV